MRMIPGKIHDYYDSMLKYNSTEGNTFHRTNDEYVFGRYDKITNDRVKVLKEILYDKSGIEYAPFEQSSKKYKLEFFCFSVLFCGKLYNGLRCPYNETNHFFYTFDDLNKFCLSHDVEIKPALKTEWSKRRAFFKIESLQKYFTPIEVLNDCVTNKMVVAVIDSFYHDYGELQITENGSLKDYQFYKVFDPFTTYQMLSQYVDGSLAYPGNIVVEIDDKYKISGKGFDPVYGFRARPKEH